MIHLALTVHNDIAKTLTLKFLIIKLFKCSLFTLLLLKLMRFFALQIHIKPKFKVKTFTSIQCEIGIHFFFFFFLGHLVINTGYTVYGKQKAFICITVLNSYSKCI